MIMEIAILHSPEDVKMIFLADEKELKAFDSIELGESVLKFVPLCGDNFNWDEYITERG